MLLGSCRVELEWCDATDERHEVSTLLFRRDFFSPLIFRLWRSVCFSFRRKVGRKRRCVCEFAELLLIVSVSVSTHLWIVFWLRTRNRRHAVIKLFHSDFSFCSTRSHKLNKILEFEHETAKHFLFIFSRTHCLIAYVFHPCPLTDWTVMSNVHATRLSTHDSIAPRGEIVYKFVKLLTSWACATLLCLLCAWHAYGEISD